MPEVCTCGAQLPPDARFCHKCGKPQRDEPLMQEDLEEVAPPPLPAIPPPVEAPAIGFHNGFAVRAAMVASAIGIIGAVLTSQLAEQLALLWLGAGGFLSVYLYQQRTRHKLTVMNGARLGWLCGIFGFTIATVFLAIAALGLNDPALLQSVRVQMQGRGFPDAAIREYLRNFQQPVGLAGIWLSLFVIFTILSACGGAICAKLLSRD